MVTVVLAMVVTCGRDAVLILVVRSDLVVTVELALALVPVLTLFTTADLSAIVVPLSVCSRLQGALQAIPHVC